ncbi:MAG TPA: hypothetical protein VGI72_07965 [Gaiellales bacterium]|jgi:hypothetical protein
MRPHLARPALVTFAVAALLAAAPAAYAIWSAPGSGTATAAAASAPQPVTIVAGAPTTQSLYPTGTPTGDVAVAITNPNPYRVRVAALVLDTGSGSGGFSADATACGLSFTPPGPGWDIPAGTRVELDLRDSLTMATWAPPSCQGLAVQVFLKAAP